MVQIDFFPFNLSWLNMKKQHPLDEIQSSREQFIPFKCLSARLCLVREQHGSTALITDFEQRQRTNLAQIRDNSTLIRNFIVFILDGLTMVHERHIFSLFSARSSLSLCQMYHIEHLCSPWLSLCPLSFPTLNSRKMLFAVFIHCHAVVLFFSNFFERYWGLVVLRFFIAIFNSV